jgi:hypothetical protein
VTVIVADEQHAMIGRAHEPYGTVAVWEDLHGNHWDLLRRAGG